MTLPLAGSLGAVGLLGAASLFSDPLRAFIELCLADPVDGGTDMGGGWLMWLWMRPELSIAMAGSALVGFGLMKKPKTAGTPAETPDPGLDLDRLYEAALWAAEATQCISPRQLNQQFTALTGLTPPVWARHVKRMLPWDIDSVDFAIFDDLPCPQERQIIMAVVLGITLQHPQARQRSREFIWRLASALKMSSKDITMLTRAVLGQQSRAIAA